VCYETRGTAVNREKDVSEKRSDGLFSWTVEVEGNA
jgi:hypothetical protein